MELICQTTDFKIEEGCAVAIGKFDGIHRGHKRLLREIFDAKKLGLKTAVFTFDPSPAVFFQGDSVKELMTREEKRIAFEKMEIDYLVEYPFCKETAAVLPEDYVNHMKPYNFYAVRMVVQSPSTMLSMVNNWTSYVNTKGVSKVPSYTNAYTLLALAKNSGQGTTVNS